MLYACLLICVCLFSAHCHFPVRGEWGGQSHANQSDVWWRHRSVPLSPVGVKRFSLPVYVFIQPGKQLPAVQISCQSHAVMKVHFTFSFSLYVFNWQCSLARQDFFLFVVHLMLKLQNKNKSSTWQMKRLPFGSVRCIIQMETCCRKGNQSVFSTSAVHHSIYCDHQNRVTEVTPGQATSHMAFTIFIVHS